MCSLSPTAKEYALRASPFAASLPPPGRRRVSDAACFSAGLPGWKGLGSPGPGVALPNCAAARVRARALCIFVSLTNRPSSCQHDPQRQVLGGPQGIASSRNQARSSVHICTPNEKTVVMPERPPKDGYEALFKEPAGTRNVDKAASAGSRRDRRTDMTRRMPHLPPSGTRP